MKNPVASFILTLFFCFSLVTNAQLDSEKLRVFVLTDIENEPDDAQSLVRFMTYSNHWDVEGIVATTSCWLRDKTAAWRIHEIIDAYGNVRDNLEIHEKGYPTHGYMKGIIKKGVPRFGMTGVGEGQDSEGSEWLIHCLKKDDPRPLYIQAWGGVNVLAQALWKMERILTVSELNKVIDKIRVYTISDQDDAGPWIRRMFPNIFYVVSPGYHENGGGQYHYATWSGISGDKYLGRFSGPDFTVVDNPWLDEHIRHDHGPLGKEYPHTEYLMEGDTPAFLGLVINGLNNPERPDYGSWGGRYELYIPPFKKYMYEPETRPIWTDTQDEVWSDITQQYHTSNHATIWRWREAFQHDFASRIDWSNTPEYSKANHPPIAKLAHPNQFSVKSGEKVKLSGAGSTDPDTNNLKYQWILYKEVGTLNADELKLEDADKQIASFVAPDVKTSKSMHLILAVTDDGSPELTRYQRVIVNILPK
ncbi:MAG: nucleoside hydrolase-like domain-containing protein [Chitinophagaceae bacterium]